MDSRLASLLQSLLLNVEVLSTEIRRLHSTEQFSNSAEALPLLQQARESFRRGLELVAQVERKISP